MEAVKLRCFLRTRERLHLVALVGRYAPGIHDLRNYSRSDILAIANKVVEIVNRENESGSGRGRR